MTTHLWASPPFTHANNSDLGGLAQSLVHVLRQDVIRVGGAAPPAASRCSARTSLRTPSRGDPPLSSGHRSFLRLSVYTCVGQRCLVLLERPSAQAESRAARPQRGVGTGPRGAAGPHNPDKALARSAPPNPENVVSEVTTVGSPTACGIWRRSGGRCGCSAL